MNKVKDMNFRNLKEEDFPNWLELWKGYQSFYKVEIKISVSEVTFKRLLNTDENMYCLVAEENGLLIGMVHYIYHRSTWTEGNYCYLQDLYVTPSERSKGLGRKLIECVYTEAVKNNISRVYWLTHETNYPGRSLYDDVADNAGFIQYRKNIG